jgi:uncharacterized protein (DUF1778 family)
MATPKLTLYVEESLRTRVKTAAAHSNQSISDFLLPFIEAALELEEEKMRDNLLHMKPKPCPELSLPKVG